MSQLFFFYEKQSKDLSICQYIVYYFALSYGLIFSCFFLLFVFLGYFLAALCAALSPGPGAQLLPLHVSLVGKCCLKLPSPEILLTCALNLFKFVDFVFVFFFF